MILLKKLTSLFTKDNRPINRIIVHIGSEKTGSTSIQNFLKLNSKKLISNDIFFPYHLFDSNQYQMAAYCTQWPLDPSQTSLLSLLNIYNEEEHIKWKRHFINKFEKYLQTLPPSATLILSSEHMHSCLKNSEEIESLHSLLVNYAKSIDCIVYFRRQDRLATSLFNQALKFGSSNVEPLKSGTAKNKYFFNHLATANDWSKTFGKEQIIFRLFQKETLYKNNLIDDFIQQINIPRMDLEQLGRMNESMTGTTQNFLLLLNKTVRTNNNTKNVYRKLRRYIANNQEIDAGIPPILPSKKEADDFLKQYAESNKSLSNVFLNGEHFVDDTHPQPNECKAQTDSIYNLMPQFIKQFEKNTKLNKLEYADLAALAGKFDKKLEIIYHEKASTLK